MLCKEMNGVWTGVNVRTDDDLLQMTMVVAMTNAVDYSLGAKG